MQDSSPSSANLWQLTAHIHFVMTVLSEVRRSFIIDEDHLTVSKTTDDFNADVIQLQHIPRHNAHLGLSSHTISQLLDVVEALLRIRHGTRYQQCCFVVVFSFNLQYSPFGIIQQNNE
jgi:hypothetical protein